MHFAQSTILHWLWTIILLVLFLAWSFQYRKRLLREFAQGGLLKELITSYSERNEMSKYIFLCLVFFFSILALSRPQWGFEWQEIKREGLDILVAVDTSKSMLTQDVKPNRLERTKLAVLDLVKKLKGDRIGLIAFAGDAFLVCPLTIDYNGFLLSLNDLDVHSIPRGGTNIAQAIEEAIKGLEIKSGKNKALIIVTDGENLEGDPLLAVKKAQERGVKIYCIGIGTKEGELVQIENEEGKNAFLKDSKGNFVKSRLNEGLLREMALAGSGSYVRSSGAEFGLDFIYEKELSKLDKQEIDAKREKRYYERFQIPLALAVVFLILEASMTTYVQKKKNTKDEK